MWFADGILPNGEVADTTRLSVSSRRGSQEISGITSEQTAVSIQNVQFSSYHPAAAAKAQCVCCSSNITSADSPPSHSVLKLCINPNNIDYQNFISVEAVSFINEKV